MVFMGINSIVIIEMIIFFSYCTFNCEIKIQLEHSFSQNDSLKMATLLLKRVVRNCVHILYHFASRDRYLFTCILSLRKFSLNIVNVITVLI